MWGVGVIITTAPCIQANPPPSDVKNILTTVLYENSLTSKTAVSPLGPQQMLLKKNTRQQERKNKILLFIDSQATARCNCRVQGERGI